MRLTKSQFTVLLCKCLNAGFINSDVTNAWFAGTLEIEGFEKGNTENAFEFFGKKFIAVEESTPAIACCRCWFRENVCKQHQQAGKIPHCKAEKRADKREVYFKLV